MPHIHRDRTAVNLRRSRDLCSDCSAFSVQLLCPRGESRADAATPRRLGRQGRPQEGSARHCIGTSGPGNAATVIRACDRATGHASHTRRYGWTGCPASPSPATAQARPVHSTTVVERSAAPDQRPSFNVELSGLGELAITSRCCWRPTGSAQSPPAQHVQQQRSQPRIGQHLIQPWSVHPQWSLHGDHPAQADAVGHLGCDLAGMVKVGAGEPTSLAIVVTVNPVDKSTLDDRPEPRIVEVALDEAVEQRHEPADRGAHRDPTGPQHTSRLPPYGHPLGPVEQVVQRPQQKHRIGAGRAASWTATPSSSTRHRRWTPVARTPGRRDPRSRWPARSSIRTAR
jgi:hypothetical protein